MTNFWRRLSAYLLLLTFCGLLLPIPKPYLAALLILSLVLYAIPVSASQPAVIFYFLVFFLTPFIAFATPSLIPATLRPLLQLALAVAIWGTFLTLLASLITLAANRMRSRLGLSSPFPSDHAPKLPN